MRVVGTKMSPIGAFGGVIFDDCSKTEKKNKVITK